MRNGNISCEHLETAGPHLVEIANATVRHQCFTFEGQEKIRIYLPDEGPQSCGLIHILDNYDAGRGNA
jgi:hypothetical protein